jgi:RHS repeat-associated protein
VAPPSSPAITAAPRTAAVEAVVVVAPTLDAQAQLVTTPSVAATTAEYPTTWPRVFENRATGKYFGARYYGSKMGRFTTIDPVFTWQENLEDPQRWNRYAYVRNNPLKYVDPDGRQMVPLMTTVKLPGAAAARTDVGIGVLEGVLMMMIPGLEIGSNSEAQSAGQFLGQGVVLGGAFSHVAGKPGVNLSETAGRVHGALDPIAKRTRTTAAGLGTDGSVIVGSSRPTLTPAQRAALRPGETAARGPGHAEATVVNAAKKAGVKIDGIAVSRPPCPSCAELLKREGIPVRN